MKKYLLFPAIFLFLFFIAVEAKGAVFAEEMTSTTCHACPAVGEALHQIYASHDYDFYYVAMVTDRVAEADERAGEYNVYGYPTTFFDGGYEVIFGKKDISEFQNAIESALERERENVNINLKVEWKGNSTIEIDASVRNNGQSSYEGNLRFYVVEPLSRWKDYDGNNYHFAFLGYALDEDISINAGGSVEKKVIWEGEEHGYEVSRDNIMVIAVVFNSGGETRYSDPPNNQHPFTAHFVDACTTASPPEDAPPSVEFVKTPGKITGYRNVSFEWTGSDDSGEVTFSYRLYGYEGWHEWEDITNASYTGLEDGEYEFMVRAKDNAGQITEIKWKFTVDTSPPHIVEHYPASNERNVPADITIRIKFSHPMDKKSVEEGISISPSVPYTIQWKSDEEVLIRPQTLEYETTYTVTIKDAKRMSGQKMNEYSFSFTTSRPDTTPPEIVYVEPYYEELMDDIRIKFNEPMDTLLHNAIIIEPWMPYTYSWEENDTLLKIHFVKYEKGIYNITLTTYLTDVYGNSIEENYSFSVYITPPKIVYTSIMDGEKNVGIDATLEIQFSHEMMEEDVEQNLSIFPPCNYTLKWNLSTLRALRVEMELKSNTTYHFQIPAGMRDIRGVKSEEPLHLNFTTIGEIERKEGNETPSFTFIMLATAILAMLVIQKRRRSIR